MLATADDLVCNEEVGGSILAVSSARQAGIQVSLAKITSEPSRRLDETPKRASDDRLILRVYRGCERLGEYQTLSS
jgi:hypothetical protein